jgi:cytoskeletal protein CcmA (bactofilin family)
MANKNFKVRHGLTVSGNAKASGNLSVQGGTLLSGAVQAKNNLSVGGQTFIAGSLQITENLTVSGTTATIVNLDANNVQASNVLSGTQIRGTSLAVTTVDAAGSLQVSGSASIGGSSILSGAVQAKSDVSVGGKLTVGGSTICTSAILASNVSTQSLQVSGNASIGGTLVVTTVDATDIQASGVLSGTQIRGTSLAVTTVDAGTVQASGTISGNALHSATTLQVSGTASVGALKVVGNTSLQAGAVVTQALQLKSELDFINPSDKHIDFALVSSDATQFSANFRSFDANTQNFHTHIKFTRAGGVELHNNNNKKLETNGNGIFVSGTVSASANVYAGQQLRAAGAVSVAGDVRGKGLLQISGTASIGGQIQAGGNVYATQQLRAGGNVSVAGAVIGKGNLHISGSASIGSGLQVDSGISCSGQVIVDQQVQADGSGLFGQVVRAGAAICAQANLFVNQAARVTGSIQAKGGISVTQTTTIAGVSFDKGWVRIGTAAAGVAIDPNEIYFSGAGNLGTISGSLTLNPAGNIVTSKAFDSTGNIVTEGTLSATTIRGVSLAVTTVDAAGAIQSAGTVSGNALHSATTLQVSGTASVGSLYSSGQVRAAGALSCAGTGHFAQGIQVCGTVSCTALHATGGQIQSTGNISGGNLLTGGIVRASGQICNALQIFSQQTVVARKNLHVSGTCCIGLTTKLVGGITCCSKLTGTQISCHKLVAQSGRVGGLCSGGGADYAEYFEWMDSNPNVSDRVGRSVVITGPSGKIGIATAGQTPFGVVTGRAMVAGNNALQRWDKKYLKDEYLRVRRDENGQKMINPDWNSACTYINRKNRPEWDAVGILGRVTVRVGEPINPNWTKLRVITATIEEYLVR